MRRLATLAASAVLLTGCSASAGHSAASSTPAAVTTSASPSPTVTEPTIAQAAARYQKIDAVTVPAVDAINALFITHGSHDMAKLRKAARAVAAANWKYAQEMRAAVWPTLISKQVSAAVDGAVGLQSDWGNLAASRNYYQFQLAWLTVQHRSYKVFDALRLSLGMPPTS